jgi:hypothetical protein
MPSYRRQADTLGGTRAAEERDVRMSHQVKPDTAAGPGPAGLAEQAAYVPQTPGTPVSYPPAFHGRPTSWVAVSMVMAGFVCGGLALVFGPVWWAFWLGVGLAVVGVMLAGATNLFDDWY